MIHFSYPVVSFAALALFLGVFLPTHTRAQTRQDCISTSEKLYAACMEKIGAVPNLLQESARCRAESENGLASCLSQADLNSDKNKTGCYCLIQPSGFFNEAGSDLSSQEVVQSFPDKNTREKCINSGSESLPNGDAVVSCKWYEPAPGKKIIPLPSGISSLNKLGLSDPGQFIGRIIKAAMGVMGTVALAMLVYAGFLFMTAAGNSDRERKALDIMLWSGLGIIVILSSYAVVQFIVQNAFVG